MAKKKKAKRFLGSRDYNGQPKIILPERIIRKENLEGTEVTMVERFRWVNEEFQQVVLFEIHDTETDSFLRNDEGIELCMVAFLADLLNDDDTLKIEME